MRHTGGHQHVPSRTPRDIGGWAPASTTGGFTPHVGGWAPSTTGGYAA
ncbi:hypothetical protein [Nonomuraea africana]